VRDIGPYAGLAGQIVAAMLVFVGGGAWADAHFGTSPLWILVGVGLAFTALGAILYRIVKESARTPREPPVKPDEAPPPGTA
jgi:F0F1-type ATP synthase assembly protein I